MSQTAMTDRALDSGLVAGSRLALRAKCESHTFFKAFVSGNHKVKPQPLRQPA